MVRQSVKSQLIVITTAQLFVWFSVPWNSRKRTQHPHAACTSIILPLVLYIHQICSCFSAFCAVCLVTKRGSRTVPLFILFLEGQEHGKSIEHPKTCILLPRVFKLSACCVLYLFNMSVNPCSFGGSWVPLGEPKRAAGAQGASSGPCLARSSARQQGSHRWGARDKPGSGSDTTLPYLQHSSHQGEKLCSRGVFKPKSM